MTTEALRGHGFFARNLVTEPGPGAVSALTPPPPELHRVFAALAQRQSVILLGPHGVGKTTLVGHLAAKIRSGEAPVLLAGCALHETSCSQMLAGTQYVGEWDTKIVEMVRALQGSGILYVDDIWNLVGTGSAASSPKDVFQYLRPRIQSQDIVLLGEMTEERWRRTQQRDGSFAPCFQTIKLMPPGPAQTRALLETHARVLSERYRIEIGPVSLARILEVTGRFIPYEVFPGKAVRLLRRLFTEATARPGCTAITPQDVLSVFSADTGLPQALLDPSSPLDPDQATGFFSARVLHQEEAVRAMVDTIAVFKARLNEPTRPIGVLFLVGPTGVGKTELAKAAAEFLFGSASRLVRLDMSEFATADAVDRLAGGTVGSEYGTREEGLLAGPVRRQPFSVVLLDEFEKAHVRVYDLMLQVFSEGRLTDARGETTDFRNTLLLMTSNLGSQKIAGGLIGFSKGSSSRRAALRQKIGKEMQAYFRPEFLNRLDHVVVFNPLDERASRRIAKRELGRLHEIAGMRDLKLTTQVEEGVVDLIVEKGFDPRFGARPLKRAIQDLVLTPIALQLVRRPVSPGAIVRVRVEDKTVVVDLLETAESEAARALSQRMEVAAGQAPPERLSVAEMAAAMPAILARIAKVEESYGLAAARERRAALEARQSSPDFWDDPEEARGLYRELQRLSADIGRLERARLLARTVLEFGELALGERDAALGREVGGEYARLSALLESLEHEMTLFTADDRRDAILTLRPVGPDPRDPAWARELLALYEGWAKRRGYQVTTLYDPDAARGARGDVAIRALVEGTYAYGYLAGESGLHKHVRKPPAREGTDPEARVAQVEVHALLEADQAPGAELERDYAFQSIGTAGRLRVYQVCARTMSREGALVLANTLPAQTNASLGRRVLRSIEAGAGARHAQDLVRTYDATSYDVVKDRRTGHRIHSVRKVLAGEIEEFLLAFLQQRRAAAH